MISNFRRDVDGIFSVLGYYAAWSGNFLSTFRDTLSDFLGLADGTDRLSRKVGKELSLYAA
jgi:hypothetical protein